MEQANILIIDDTPQNLEFLRTILETRYKVRYATEEKIAFEVAQLGWANIILLNQETSKIDGYKICQQLKANQETNKIPIIFLSSFTNDLEKVKAFKIGVSDYLPQPLQEEEVLIKITQQLQINQAQNIINSFQNKVAEVVHKKTDNLYKFNKKLQIELQQHQQTQEQLKRLALHDSITGLPNRNSFLGKLKQLLSQYQKQSEYQFAILLINCNLGTTQNNIVNFAEIKCYLQHDEVNQLLIAIATKLQSCLPHSATLSRFEDNQFGIILEKITEGKQELIKWVQIIQQQFILPFQITLTKLGKKQEIMIVCHVGVVTNNDHYSAAYEFLQDAEIAVYQAQTKESNNYHFFNRKQQYHQNKKNILLNTVSVEQQIKDHFFEAIQRNKIKLYYQPIFAIKQNLLKKSHNLAVKGLEVLGNQHNSYQKLIFLTNLGQEIDKIDLKNYINNFTLEFACSTLKELQDQHEKEKNLFLIMKCDEHFILQNELNIKLEEILNNTQLNPQYLHLDLILNNFLLENTQVLAFIKNISDLGIKLNLNCNYLNYKQIKNIIDLPFTNLNLASSLLQKIVNPEQYNQQLNQFSTLSNLSLSDEKKAQIEIARIINLAHENQIKVTAQGISSQEQLNFLNSVGCDYGQGNLLSKPLDRVSLDTFLIWRI